MDFPSAGKPGTRLPMSTTSISSLWCWAGGALLAFTSQKQEMVKQVSQTDTSPLHQDLPMQLAKSSREGLEEMEQHPCSSVQGWKFPPSGEEPPEAMMAAAAGDSSCSTRFSFSFPPPGPMGSAGLHPVFTQQGCSPEHCCCSFAFWGSVPPQGPHKGGKAWEHHGHPPGW